MDIPEMRDDDAMRDDVRRSPECLRPPASWLCPQFPSIKPRAPKQKT